eukprot:PhF_6_TR15922/c0_g1_i2/m.24664
MKSCVHRYSKLTVSRSKSSHLPPQSHSHGGLLISPRNPSLKKTSPSVSSPTMRPAHRSSWMQHHCYASPLPHSPRKTASCTSPCTTSSRMFGPCRYSWRTWLPSTKT